MMTVLTIRPGVAAKINLPEFPEAVVETSNSGCNNQK